MTQRRSPERLTAWVGLAATAVGTFTAVAKLTDEINLNDLFVASLSMAIAVAAGGLSVYIARAAKKLPRTPRIFISYSSDEKERGRELRDIFQRRGAKVWFDENVLQPGADLGSSIGAAIESSNTVVVIMSSQFGTHLEAELRAAADRQVPVFAIITGDASPAEPHMKGENVRVLNYSAGLEQAVDEVLAAR